MIGADLQVTKIPSFPFPATHRDLTENAGSRGYDFVFFDGEIEYGFTESFKEGHVARTVIKLEAVVAKGIRYRGFEFPQFLIIAIQRIAADRLDHGTASAVRDGGIYFGKYQRLARER